MSTQAWSPFIDTDVCTGCGTCIDSCIPGALAQTAGKAALIYPERCTYCAVCEALCPVRAIQLPYLIRKRNTSEEETL